MRLPGAVRPVQIYEELEARAVHGKQLELKNRWNRREREKSRDESRVRDE